MSPTPDLEKPPPPPREGGSWRLFAGPVLVLAALVVAGRFAGAHWPAIESRLDAWGPWGGALFCATWVVLSSLCFPVSVFGFSAGVLFGLGTGVALVLVSANVAALLMFALGRGLLRGRILAFVATRPRLAAIDRLAGEKALRLNALTRLSPLNYGLACYTLAAGRSRLRDYLLGNLATIPSLVFQVWLGTVAVRAGAADDPGATPRNIALLVVGIVVVAVLGWQISRLVRQALAEEAGDAAADDPAARGGGET